MPTTTRSNATSKTRKLERHGQALVTKRFRGSGRYWVTLSFPDLPDIFCLDESAQQAPRNPTGRGYKTELDRKAKVLLGIRPWRHENFITATWEGIRVFDFQKSYERLKDVLGEKFFKDLNWQPFHPYAANSQRDRRNVKLKRATRKSYSREAPVKEPPDLFFGSLAAPEPSDLLIRI